MMKIDTVNYNVVAVIDILQQQNVIKSMIRCQTTTLILAAEVDNFETGNVDTDKHIILAFTIGTKLIIVGVKEAHLTESESCDNEIIKEVSSIINQRNGNSNIVAKVLVSVTNDN